MPIIIESVSLEKYLSRLEQQLELLCGYDLLTGLVLAAVGITLGVLGLTSLKIAIPVSLMNNFW